MPIEEKDNRLCIKVTPQQLDQFFNDDMQSDWEDDLADTICEALETARIFLARENRPQEILIVVDKGF